MSSPTKAEAYKLIRQEDVIKACKRLLDQANKGEIDGIAVVTHGREGACSEFHGYYTMELIGELERMKLDMLVSDLVEDGMTRTSRKLDR